MNEFEKTHRELKLQLERLGVMDDEDALTHINRRENSNKEMDSKTKSGVTNKETESKE